MTAPTRSLVRAITRHPDDAVERLKELRLIVAERLDATESARETAGLSRVMLDIESALRSLVGGKSAASPVDELLERRSQRGAK